MDSDVKKLLSEVTDIRACLNKPDMSLQFPGPVLLRPEFSSYALEMATRFQQLGVVDATLEHEGVVWRGHLDGSVVDGPWVSFRKMPPKPPTLDTLPTPLPAAIHRFLLQPELCEGGLVLIAGPTGAGKTTTASAVVVSRLMALGGFASTVEQPPEQPLNGWHRGPSRAGYCSQAWVKMVGDSPWADALSGVLRSQSAGTANMLFVGEIREDEAARVALQAAGNGFLVICTSFATDLVSAVQSFGRRLDASQQEMYSLLLRGVVFQKLAGKLLTAKLLEATLPVQQSIALQKYASLEGEAQRQANERFSSLRSQEGHPAPGWNPPRVPLRDLAE